MTSTKRRFGKVVPLCRRCGVEADAVAVYPEGDVFVGCHPCINTALGATGREYPLETYYKAGSRECVEFEPVNADEFDLYDPDDGQRSWISADNEGGDNSSVALERWV